MRGAATKKREMASFRSCQKSMSAGLTTSTRASGVVFQEDAQKAWCYKHKQWCHCWSMKDRVGLGPLGLCLAVAGTTCTDLSRYGLRRQFSGQAAAPYWAWIRQRQHLQEDVVIHENVPAFPVHMLEKHLQGTHSIWPLVVCPSQLGQPTTGRRCLIAAVKKQCGSLVAPLNAAAWSIFCRTAKLTGDVYFACETGGEEMSGTTRGSLKAGDEARLQVHISNYLKKKGIRHLSQLSGGFVNLTQSSVRAGISSRMPRPTASACKLYSLTQGRCLLPREHLLVQLLPSIPGGDWDSHWLGTTQAV